NHPAVIVVTLDLEIENLDEVPGAPRRLGNELEPKRFEPQKHLCVKQRTGMDEQGFHRTTSVHDGRMDHSPKSNPCYLLQVPAIAGEWRRIANIFAAGRGPMSKFVRQPAVAIPPVRIKGWTAVGRP